MHNIISYKSRHNFIFRNQLKKVDYYRSLSQNELEELKNQKFLKLYKHAIKNSKFYKELYKKYGLNENSIKSINDIKKLPEVSKNDIRDRIDDVLTTYKRWVVKGYTSGTSGSPLTVYRSPMAILREHGYLMHYRIRNGLKPRDSKVSIRGDLNKDTIYTFDRASNTLFFSSYNLNKHQLKTFIKLISDYQPKALIGYPSSLFILANEFQKADIQLSIPLAFTSSETLYEFQKKTIENTFNSSVYDWYGNSERTIAMEQCELGHYHEVPGYSITEYYNDHIISTSLINNAFPLIRYRTDDVINSVQNDCECGLNTVFTKQITGRSDDFIYLKDGTTIGSPGISTSFKNIDHIIYTQIVQSSKSSIDLNLVVHEAFYETEGEKHLLKNLKNRIGNGLEINIRYVAEEDLLKSRNGKYKLIVNEVK